MGEEIERIEGGSELLRHEESDRGWQVPEESGRNYESLTTHLEKYLGETDLVFHELVSDMIHLDVLVFPATEARPFHVLATSGARDLPMTMPPDVEAPDRIELMIALPPEWPLDSESWENENHYWPCGWLKQLGRLPHEHQTWLGDGHTIATDEPPAPIANTKFTGLLVTGTPWLDDEAVEFESESGDRIALFSVVPLYQEEMELKLAQGGEALEELFVAHGVDAVIDPRRRNVAKKRGFLGWFKR